MSSSLISTSIYLLGFIGLVSIGLIPFRSWQAMRSLFGASSQHAYGRVFTALSLLMTAAALWIDVQITARIFKCLTEAYCGPGIGSGWTYLAMLGVVYIAFESMVFLVSKISQAKAVRPAT